MNRKEIFQEKRESMCVDAWKREDSLSGAGKAICTRLTGSLNFHRGEAMSSQIQLLASTLPRSPDLVSKESVGSLDFPSTYTYNATRGRNLVPA